MILWSALQSRQSFFSPYGLTALLTDFLLNVGMPLLAMTAYSSAPTLLLAMLLTPAFFISIASQLAPGAKTKLPFGNPKSGVQKASSGLSTASLPIYSFLSVYRGSMLVMTCLAILAVDFRVFPRRFAKVETWGTSLMDLGVGSFVFSAGVVSARSLIKSRLNIRSHRSLPSRFLTSLGHSLPLLVLGFIRLLSVKNLSYAEHVTEYGVHWNFFFTLAFLDPFVEMLDTITALIPSYDILVLILGVTYQVLLDSTSLTRYILLSPRGPDLLSQNREGVFSFAGYLAIFLAGRGLGAAIFAPATAARSNSNLRQPTSFWKEQKPLALALSWRALLYTALFYLTQYPSSLTSVSVSRRLANLPYILWVTAFNASQILLLCGIEMLFFPYNSTPQFSPSSSQTSATLPNDNLVAATSRILAAFNTNGLAIFLGANLLTGAVNLSVNTLDMNFLGAMGVLTTYVVTVTGLVLGLEWTGWKLRL